MNDNGDEQRELMFGGYKERPKRLLSLWAIALLMPAFLVTTSLGCTEKSPAALLEEIRTLREEILSGEVVVDWHPDEHSYLPSDPLNLLDYAERKTLSPDISVYFYQEDLSVKVGTLQAEMETWPGVEKVVFVSGEEKWAENKRQAELEGLLTFAEASVFVDTFEIHLTDWDSAQMVVNRLSEEIGNKDTTVHDKSSITANLELLHDSVHSR